LFTDSEGGTSWHSDNSVSASVLIQNQQASHQAQHQDHPHPGKEKHSYAKTYKRKLGLKIAGIYHVPCECSEVCVGQAGKSIETRCKEHMT
jgi:hypothetical protein